MNIFCEPLKLLKRSKFVPKLKSSKKRLKQEMVRQKRNSVIKSTMRSAIKKVRENTEADDMQDLLKHACSKLDKAAKRGIIHKRTAARQKSRLMKVAHHS
jgi:small subunit ribosomal protein S20